MSELLVLCIPVGFGPATAASRNSKAKSSMATVAVLAGRLLIVRKVCKDMVHPRIELQTSTRKVKRDVNRVPDVPIGCLLASLT